MRKNIIFFSILFIVKVSMAQVDSVYLGQATPGTTPQLFGYDLMLGNNGYCGHRISISKDGKEIYFSKRNGPPPAPQNIQYLKYENNKWNGPFVLFPDFPNQQTAQAFSLDGNTLYFQSIQGQEPLYYTERDSNGWTTPQLFKDYTNNLFYFQETNNSYYATTNYAANGLGENDICEIIIRNDTIAEVRSLGAPLNTEGSSESTFYMAKDESYIILGRNQNFTTMNRDLFISYKKEDDTWTNPKSLGTKINNGTTLKWGPYVTTDNKYLFYESDEIRWTFWWIRFDHLLDSLKRTNFEPYVKSAIPDQIGTVGHYFSYTISDTIFIDDDGNNTLTYTASLSNNDAIPEKLFDFDPLTETFSGTPDTTGTFNIKVTATDTANATASTKFMVTINNSISLIDQKREYPVKIHPNPSNGLFTISFNSSTYINTIAEIYNSEGKLMLIKNIHQAGTDLIDLTNKPDGIYLARIKVDNNWHNLELMKCKL